MQKRKQNCTGGYSRFFSLSLCHESLVLYFKLNFQLMQHHKYSLSELENMLPWEREIYLNLLTKHVQEQNDKMKQQAQR